MAYIWENYSTQKKFRLMKKISPYIEAIELNKAETAVNPLLRFAPVFDAFNRIDERLNKNALADTVFHYLARLDRCAGFTDSIAELSFLNNEIENGFMGLEAQTLWRSVDAASKLIFLCCLREQFRVGSRENYFFAATSSLFPNAAIYMEKSSGQYYIFIGADKTVDNQRKARLLEYFFWDMHRKSDWVWTNHFGIIEHEPTMIVDRIQII